MTPAADLTHCYNSPCEHKARMKHTSNMSHFTNPPNTEEKEVRSAQQHEIS